MEKCETCGKTIAFGVEFGGETTLVFTPSALRTFFTAWDNKEILLAGTVETLPPQHPKLKYLDICQCGEVQLKKYGDLVRKYDSEENTI